MNDMGNQWPQRPDGPPPVGSHYSPPSLQPHYSPPPGSEPTLGQRLKKLFAPIGVVLVLIVKFAAKLKFLLPLFLKTGGSMIISVVAYSLAFGWWAALGFVLLLFVHECGHLIVARCFGLKVGAPVFIPFMGAFIALKEAPRDAWMEAWVGIGGPLLGTAGAVVCLMLYVVTANPLFQALAHIGFFLNLFNLAPLGQLDGGRIVTALSPWLWLVGAVILGAMMVMQPHFLIALILILSLPRLFFLFRKKTDEERRYFEVSPGRRLTMAGMYFGLIVFLFWSLAITQPHPQQRAARGHQPRSSPAESWR